jgi:hypothetical protein
MAKASDDEREITIKEWTERSGHDLSFLKRARRRGMPVRKYGKSVRILWSEWIAFREQHKQVG